MAGNKKTPERALVQTQEDKQITDIVGWTDTIKSHEQGQLLKWYAERRIREIEARKLTEIEIDQKWYRDYTYEGYFASDFNLLQAHKRFINEKRHTIIATTQVNTDNLQREMPTQPTESEEAAKPTPELAKTISLEGLTPEQKRALETPAVVKHMKEIGVINRNWEFQIDNPQKIQQVIRYADYVYFIDNAETNGESQIQDVKWLVENYKNLLWETTRWLGADKIRYLQHQYSHTIYNEVIRRNHIIRRKPKGNNGNSWINGAFEMVQYDGRERDKSNNAIQELNKILDKDDIRTELLEVAMISSIVEKSSTLNAESIVSPEELGRHIIEKHNIKSRRWGKLAKVEFSAIDWGKRDSNGNLLPTDQQWEHYIWSQIDARIKELTGENTADVQELVWFKHYVESGEYQDKSYNTKKFSQMNMYRAGAKSVAELMKSIPQDIEFDANDPIASLASFSGRLGSESKSELIVAGIVAFIMSFLSKGKISETLKIGGWIAILAPFILAATWKVVGTWVKSIPESELKMIDPGNVIPSINYDEESQYDTYAKMYYLNDANAEYVEQTRTNAVWKQVWTGKYRGENGIASRKLGPIFERLIELNPNKAIPVTWVDTAFTASIYTLLQTWTDGTLKIGGHDISKTELRSFLRLLVQASPNANNIKDALSGGEEGDIENQIFKDVRPMTGIADFDDQLNTYMETAWNTSWAERTMKRKEVLNLQAILSHNTFLPGDWIIADVQNTLFERSAITKINKMIAGAESANYTNKNYIGLLRDAKVYIEVSNERRGYRANPTSPTNVDAAWDAVAWTINSGRNLLADAFGATENPINKTLELLTTWVDKWEEFVRGFASLMVGMTPDWRWGQKVVDDFISQRWTDARSGAAQATDRVAPTVNTSTIEAIISPEDKRLFTDIFDGMGDKVDDKIKDFEAMKKNLTTDITHPKLLAELLEKVEIDLANLRNMRAEITAKKREALQLSSSPTVDQGSLETMYKDAPWTLLGKMILIDRYMSWGRNNGVFSLDFQSIIESWDRNQIKEYSRIRTEMISYYTAFHSKTGWNENQKLVQEMGAKFGTYITEMKRQENETIKMFHEKDAEILTKAKNIKTWEMIWADISSYHLDVDDIQEISAYVEQTRVLWSTIDQGNITIRQSEVFKELQTQLGKVKTNADAYISELLKPNSLSWKTQEQMVAIRKNLNGIQEVAVIASGYNVDIDTSVFGSYIGNNGEVWTGIFKDLAIAYFDTASVSAESDLDRSVNADLSKLRNDTNLESKLWSDYNVIINRLTTAWGKTITEFEVDYLEIKETILDPLTISENAVFTQTKPAIDKLYNKFK